MTMHAFYFYQPDLAGYAVRPAPRNAMATQALRWVILSLMTASVSAHAAPGERIDEFIKCVNKRLSEAPKPVDVSATVACIPKECSVTATKSEKSAQPACTLSAGTTEVIFPRVIFFCPNKEETVKGTLIPEYTLCPKKRTCPDKESVHGCANRVEIGEVNMPDPLDLTGDMFMAHFDLIPTKNPTPINSTMAKNRVAPGGGTQECNSCHDDAGMVKDPPNADLLLSTPTFKVFGKTPDPVIFTNQKGKKPPPKPIPLKDVCDAITKNQDGLLKINDGTDDKPLINKESLAVALNLCKAINMRFFP